MSEMRRHGSRARNAIFAPLSDVGRAGQVEQRLTEAIRSGVLVEGERLPSEAELAGRFGVAVVTVREALIGLRAQGLVTTTRGRDERPAAAAGATVDEEALAERLGAERADEDEADSLHRLLDSDPAGQGRPQGGVGAWRHADAELWLSLAALTQSSRVTREVVRLEADFGMIVRIPLGDEPFREETWASHRRLVDAIAAGDPAAARKLAQTHLQETLDRVARTQAEIHDRHRMPRSAS